MTNEKLLKTVNHILSIRKPVRSMRYGMDNIFSFADYKLVMAVLEEIKTRLTAKQSEKI